MQAQTSLSVKNYLNREQLDIRSHLCCLVVNIAKHQIQLMVADTNQHEVLGLCVIETPQQNLFEADAATLKQILQSFEYFEKDFNQVVINIESALFTVIPDALFVSEKVSSYLKLTHRIPNHFTALHTRNQNRIHVYALPETFAQGLKSIWPAAVLQHYTSVLLEAVFNSMSKSEKDTLHVNVHKDFMNLIHVGNSELQLINTFPFESDTDIVYFILSVAEQQKINHDKLRIVLSGEISQTSSLVGLLKKYIPEIQLQVRPEEYTYPASFREFQEQQYYTSMANLLCEL